MVYWFTNNKQYTFFCGFMIFSGSIIWFSGFYQISPIEVAPLILILSLAVIVPLMVYWPYPFPILHGYDSYVFTLRMLLSTTYNGTYLEKYHSISIPRSNLFCCSCGGDLAYDTSRTTLIAVVSISFNLASNII